VSASAGSEWETGINKWRWAESSRCVTACCQQASATRQAATDADEIFSDSAALLFLGSEVQSTQECITISSIYTEAYSVSCPNAVFAEC
jgi:hypothetical protein